MHSDAHDHRGPKAPAPGPRVQVALLLLGTLVLTGLVSLAVLSWLERST